MVEIDLQLDCDVSPEKMAVLVTLLQEFLMPSRFLCNDVV